MNNLNVAEEVIGPLYYWPAYVLENLFCNPLTAISRVVIAAFLYGNRFPLYLGTSLVSLCNPYYSSFDGISINGWFDKWRVSYADRYMRSYYNVRRGLVFDLNDEFSNYTLRRGRRWLARKTLKLECIDIINVRLLQVGYYPLTSHIGGFPQEYRTPQILDADRGVRDVVGDPDLMFLLEGVFDEEY